MDERTTENVQRRKEQRDVGVQQLEPVIRYQTLPIFDLMYEDVYFAG